MAHPRDRMCRSPRQDFLSRDSARGILSRRVHNAWADARAMIFFGERNRAGIDVTCIRTPLTDNPPPSSHFSPAHFLRSFDRHDRRPSSPTSDLRITRCVSDLLRVSFPREGPRRPPGNSKYLVGVRREDGGLHRWNLIEDVYNFEGGFFEIYWISEGRYTASCVI